jgi:hypothetical protein
MSNPSQLIKVNPSGLLRKYFQGSPHAKTKLVQPARHAVLAHFVLGDEELQLASTSPLQLPLISYPTSYNGPPLAS